MNTRTSQLSQLLALMAQLRDPDSGCPWSKAQTFASLVPYTIEEAYEVADAIARKDFDALSHELGDLLYQVVFYAQMAKEAGLFDFDDVARTIIAKQQRRKPEYFAGLEEDKTTLQKISATDAHQQWEKTKHQHRQHDGEAQESILDGVAMALPAMTRAVKLQNRAAQIGFDWPDVQPVFAKLREEADELAHEISQAADKARVAEELGDLLFCVANLARHLNLDPEATLRAGNAKFEKRFKALEQLIKADDKDAQQLALAELEMYWQKVKSQQSKS